MKNLKICLISLGCEKNLVDSEIILGMFNEYGYIITPNKAKADVIIVNTCGFIEDAKKEAIDTILDALDYQKNGTKVIVVGCLVQRYYDDLIKEIPEVDLYVRIKDYLHLGEKVEELLADKIVKKGMCFKPLNRLVSTPAHMAYVRISEGCNNRCTYCAIPLIRGSFVSRNKDDILTEIKGLVKEGRKEICLISQDVTNYGYDLTDINLAKLLTEIVAIDGDFKVRLLYLYPDEISNELIYTIKNNDKIMPYFDIPLQSASNKILKAMHRRGSREFVLDLMNKIRNLIPDAIFRTTMIVGFPGETDSDFNDTLEFIKIAKFNHLGAFKYSPEDDTAAALMEDQIDEDLKTKRYNELMEVQKMISYEANKAFIGRKYSVIIEGYNEDNNAYFGRSYFLAPDDIDGEIYIEAGKELEISKEYLVEITDASFYDLFGKVVSV